MLPSRFFRRGPGSTKRTRSFWPTVEVLDGRVLPAVTTSFQNGVLILAGNAAADSIALTVGTGNKILLNGAGIGGNPKLTNTRAITVLGNGGGDTIDLSGLTGIENTSIAVRMDGGAGNDTITGSAGDDVISGRAGDDSLNGGDGDDLLVEAGNVSFALANNSLTGLGLDSLNQIEHARLTGGPSANSLLAPNFDLGSVTLIAGAGNDTLQGSDEDDVLMGQSGNDSFLASGDIDQIREAGNVNFTLTDTSLTGRGNDTIELAPDNWSAFLTGGGGNNVLNASTFSGSVTLIGGGGDDRLSASIGHDSLSGGAGADKLLAGDGFDSLSGGSGNDTLDGGNDADSLFEQGNVNFTLLNTKLVGPGIDKLVSIQDATLIAGGGNNKVNATAFSGFVKVFGGAGNDTLLGPSNADSEMHGGNGNDLLVGGDAENDLSGDAGNDRLIGGDNRDLLSGGTGNDLLKGAAGNDNLSGGRGIDTLQGGDGNDNVEEFAEGGADLTLTDNQLTGLGNDALSLIETANLHGGDGDNTLDTSAFTLGTVTLSGGDGNDILVAGGGNDRLFGDDGDDSLSGGAGDDDLSGKDGADTVEGGTGNDELLGGLGNDTLNGGDGTDTIGENEHSDMLLSVGFLFTTGELDLFSEIEQATLALDNPGSIDASTFPGPVSLFGTSGADTLKGSDQDDSIGGAGGNDSLIGNGGNDTLDGNNGTDILRGGSGNDSLEGGNGPDILDGGTGTDTADDDGTDTLISIP